MKRSRFLSKEHGPSKPVRAKKSLGQNFLVDKNAIGRILDACAFTKNDAILEIGPGTGALTREIIPRVGRFMAVETDQRLFDRLTEEFHGIPATFVHADFLKFDSRIFVKGQERVKVFGNLPYYISTPIITKVLAERHLFSEFFLTVQWEFAQRMVARAGEDDYSSFSCFVQFYAEPQIFFKLKSTCFRPAPKVDSCFLKLKMRPAPLYQSVDEDFLFKVIRLGFQQRRKTILNALSVLLPKDQLAGILKVAGIDPSVRAESLDLERFVSLTTLLKKAH
jgi:16S rRNA (adenine1518-N6/adenine1519-N6)-dimethyltransferase